jgi:hypothetical protein
MSSSVPLLAVPNDVTQTPGPAGSDEAGVTRNAVTPLDEIDFSLIQGGPFFQLLLRAGLLKQPTDLVTRRIVALLLITWVPPLLLSALAGRALGGVAVPFFHDIGEQVRFLLCAPLLMAADVIVHRRIRPVVAQFIERGVVGPEDVPRFKDIIAATMRVRNSMLAEVFVLVLAIVAGLQVGERYSGLSVSNWATLPVDGHPRLTAAGYWNLCVSFTLFRFLLLRWYFRLVVWGYFLARVSWSIPLRLNALHPDRAAGLGFLSGSVFSLAPILLVNTTLLSASIANKILYEGAKLPQFKVEITAWILCLVLLVLAPLLAFMTHLGEARRRALREYGVVASRYVAEFRRKWVEGHAGEGEALVGSADIQSLADLANSYDVARETNLVPFGWVVVVRLIIVLAIPLLPLSLTMIPLGELIDRAVKMLI